MPVLSLAFYLIMVYQGRFLILVGKLNIFFWEKKTENGAEIHRYEEAHVDFLNVFYHQKNKTKSDTETPTFSGKIQMVWTVYSW